MDAIPRVERRAVTRLPGTTIDPIRLRLDGGHMVAPVQDISVLGIGVLLRQRLQPGTWLVLEPVDPARHLSPELKAEVRHAQLFDTGEFLIGCRFSRYLTMEDIVTLG